LVPELPAHQRAEREEQMARIAARYDALSRGYQATKGESDIPLA
jgi:hypothetical protein